VDILAVLLRRDAIIAFALAGAAIATVASYMLKREESINPAVARFLLRFGYGVTFISVALFIAAGFLGA
jgi:hypothetical protein